MSRPMIALFAFMALWFPSATPSQDSMLKVKGGHQLGESSDQFFGEGFEKQALTACAAGDYKGVEKWNKRELKSLCAHIAAAREQAGSGKRYDYKGGGDVSERRTDTFTFDNAYLVKVELVFAAPSADANYRGQSFEQILAGLKQAYGSPTNESTQPATNTYGVRYTAHRELWLTPQAAILVVEKPGETGSTTLSAFTRREYDRSMGTGAKPTNPLE